MMNGRSWRPEEDAILKAVFPFIPNSQVVQALAAAGFSRSVLAVQHRGNLLGLQRNEIGHAAANKARVKTRLAHTPPGATAKNVKETLVYNKIPKGKIFPFRRRLTATEIYRGVSSLIDNGWSWEAVADAAGLREDEYRKALCDGLPADIAGGMAKLLGIKK